MQAWKIVGDKYRCQECGAEFPLVSRCTEAPCHHSCTAEAGLGDKVQQLLTSIGITQDRYQDVKRRFGMPPVCDCDARREWLNEVGRWFRSHS